MDSTTGGRCLSARCYRCDHTGVRRRRKAVAPLCVLTRAMRTAPHKARPPRSPRLRASLWHKDCSSIGLGAPHAPRDRMCRRWIMQTATARSQPHSHTPAYGVKTHAHSWACALFARFQWPSTTMTRQRRQPAPAASVVHSPAHTYGMLTESAMLRGSRSVVSEHYSGTVTHTLWRVTASQRGGLYPVARCIADGCLYNYTCSMRRCFTSWVTPTSQAFVKRHAIMRSSLCGTGARRVRVVSRAHALSRRAWEASALAVMEHDRMHAPARHPDMLSHTKPRRGCL